MALTGIQIFKMTPKKNCKECGCPTVSYTHLGGYLRKKRGNKKLRRNFDE